MRIPTRFSRHTSDPIPGLLACLLAALPAAGAMAAEPGWRGPLVFVQEPAGAWEKSGKKGWPLRIAKPEGARIAIGEPKKGVRILTERFASACDPCVSMDGTRILFAGKERAGDSWNIFEIGIDGSGLRKITEGLGDCFEPEYLARGAIIPPDYKDKVRWIVFASTAPGNLVEAGAEKATSLHARSLEPIPDRGIVTWRTTFNLSSDFSPTVLSDGRVLYSSWRNFPGLFGAPAAASSGPSPGTVELFTVSWSGEDVNLFLPSPAPGLVRTMASETPDRSVVFVESDGSEPDRSGRLARVWLRRPLKTFEVLSKVPGRFRNPRPLPDGALLVSYAPEGKGFGLYLFDFAQGGPGELVHDDPKWSDVDAMPIVPRQEPLGRITMYFEKAKTAALTCLNVYDSDRPEVRAIPKGAVKKVRLVEGLPAGKDGPGSPPAARILGEAPVEADGSFLLQTLPRTPFAVQLLDSDGAVLAAMRAWIWLQPGDERGCIGCHEDKELSPEDRVTQALLKGTSWPVLSPPGERRAIEFTSFLRPGAAKVEVTNRGSR